MNLLLTLVINLFVTGFTLSFTFNTQNITDCNDLNRVLFFKMDENTKTGFVLYNISLGGVKEFRLVSFDSYLTAKVEGGYGIISLRQPFDYEAMKRDNYQHQYRLICEYTYYLAVIIDNVVEESPNFNKTVYNITIEENTPIGSTIITEIKVEQGDATTDDLHIDSTNIPSAFRLHKLIQFTVNPELKYSLILNQNISYVVKNKYEFSLNVYVIADPSKRGSARVIINIKDVDDQNPKFTYPTYEINIQEWAVVNSRHTTNPPLFAADLDIGINATINYELIHEYPEKNWLSVDRNTGEIIVYKPPDREECDHLTLFVKGYQVDNKDFRYDVTWVSVTILDVDDNPPILDQASYAVSIPENAPVHTNIVQVHGTDIDKGDNAKFYLYFHFPNKNETICNGTEIDKDTGMIQVHQSSVLDREATPIISCQVIAKADKGLLQSNISSVTITLLDENDNNPVFDSSKYSYTIKKNIETGHTIGQVNAEDKDENSNVTYKISDTSFNTFKVDAKTGKITLISSLIDTFSKLYTFEVVASDGDKKAPRYTSVNVFIHVEDVNIHVPRFDAKQYNVTVLEDIAIGTNIVQLKAVDKDPDDNLTFTIAAGNLFDINKSSGIIFLAQKLDYEEKTSHSVSVFVNDSVHSASTNVIVSLVDINDNAPKFSNTTYSFLNIPEETTNIMVGTVHATDADTSLDNKQIIYSIYTPWSQNFTIDKNTGVIKVRGHLDREILGENGTITFIVMATDHGQPSLTGTAEVIVAVSDVNDHCPYYSVNDQHITYVFKEYEKPQHFHNFMPIDDDITIENRRSLFSFPNFRLLGLQFTANNSFVFLFAEYPLKLGFREIKQVNTLTFNLSQNCPMKTEVTHTVTIIVEDVNDHIPVFTSNTYSFVVPENVTEGRKINSIKANDEDPTAQYNTVIYRIIRGNEDGHFHIDSYTGDIFLLKQLNYETKKNYTLQITATDGQPYYNSSIVRTSTASVEITVSNVNVN